MEQLIVALFLVFCALEFTIEFVLNELNLRYVRARWAEKQIPDFFRGKIGSDEYEKSVQYTLARGRFERWAEIYGRCLLLTVLFSGLLNWLDRFSGELAQRFSLGVYGHGILFCLAVGLVFSTAQLPINLYSTFGLETKFGFNKTTIGLYIADKIKALMLKTPQHVAVSEFEATVDPDLWKEDKIDTPVLMILAKQPVWTTEYEQFVRGLIPKLDYQVWENVSHFLMMEKPREFNAALTVFLQQNQLL